MNASPRSASWAVYRSIDLTPPAVVTDDALFEVTLSWGDDVLSVAHLARGDRFEHALEDGATLRVTHGASVDVEVPEGASAWVLRDGVCEDRRATFALPIEARACVARGGLTLRVRRVDVAEPLPRARRVTGFAAAVTCALALAVTGGVYAQTPDDADSAFTARREDPRPWLLAHIVARSEEAPPRAREADGLPLPRGPIFVSCLQSCCFGCFGCFGAPWSPEEPWEVDDRFIGYDTVFDSPGFMPSSFDRRAPRRADSVRLRAVTVMGVTAPSDLRRQVLRRVSELARCNVAPEGPRSRDRRVTLRFVIGGDGSVLASGVASSTDPYVAVADCMAQHARRWSFSASPRAVTTVEASFALR